VTGEAAEQRYGRAAYEAYCAQFDNRSAITGEPLPTFAEQRPDIQDAWVAAALAARAVE
jgi:hypothetical protein